MSDEQETTCGPTHYAGCPCHEAGWEQALAQTCEERDAALAERDAVLAELTALRVLADAVRDMAKAAVVWPWASVRQEFAAVLDALREVEP